jgi:DNA-binding CsgD family transcriptional regulator
VDDKPTPRELQVEDLLCRGYSQENIAAIFGRSVNTISVHAMSLYRKRGVHTQVGMCSAQLSALSISGNSGIGSASMYLTGTATVSVTANANGAYIFRDLKPGKYVLTPRLTGYTFSSPSNVVTITNTNLASVNFTATAALKETDLSATPASFSLTAAGATEQLRVEASYSNESSENVSADATYATNNAAVARVSQTGLVTAMANGSATIVASYGGMASSVIATVNIPEATYSISGSVGVASATITLSGASSAATTASSNGAYSFGSLKAGNYSIAPTLSGYTFSPTSQSTSVTNENVAGINFTATDAAHLVDLTWGAGTIRNPAPGQVVVGYDVYRGSASGGPYTKLNLTPVPGLTYTDKNVSAGQTWYYVCSTVDNLGDVSGYSNQASATIPK